MDFDDSKATSKPSRISRRKERTDDDTQNLVRRLARQTAVPHVKYSMRAYVTG